jgi:prepilin-type N-terminal cleavage/methylation domain-containing protein
VLRETAMTERGPWGRRAAQRGFSLIELGIVLAVIAVLAAIVVMGVGQISSAKEHNAVKLVGAIQVAARTYAAREKKGLAFSSIGSLGSYGLPDSQKVDPWGGTPSISAGGAGCTGGYAGDSSYLSIVFTSSIPADSRTKICSALSGSVIQCNAGSGPSICTR